MKRTLSTSRTLNNVSQSTGISAADKQQITDNKDNINLLDIELTDLSANTIGGITIEISDLSSNYFLYKSSNNAALASAVGDIATNTSAVGTLTSGLSAAVGDIATNTSGLSAAVGDIATNTSGLSAAVGDIATNTSGLAAVVGDITAIESAATTLQGRVNANETTLLGKQDTLSNSSNISLRTLTFPDVVAAGNILLPGNTQLFSGNAPSGVQAKIQNGNLIDFISLENTLLKTCTLGASWKYQNAASYSVVNENNNKILEQIDPASGSHNWYKAGDTSVVMAWQASNDRLYLTGDVLANKYLHRISGTVVRGYGFLRFQGTSGSVNMNTTTGIDVPWTNVHVDGQTFVPTGTTQVKIVTTGYYEIGFNIYCTSTATRANPTIRLRVNGTDTGYLAWSYIRNTDNHNENSWTLSPILISLSANDLISVQGRFTSNGGSGGCYLYSNSGATNKAYSTLMLKRVA